MRTEVKVALIFLGLLMLVAITARVTFLVFPPLSPPPPESLQWITLHFYYEYSGPHDPEPPTFRDAVVQIAQSRLKSVPAQIDVHLAGPRELDVRVACSPHVYKVLADNPSAASLLRSGLQFDEPSTAMKSIQAQINAAGGGKGGDPSDIVRTLTANGILEFRIAPSPTDIDPTSDDYRKAADTLRDSGPIKSVTVNGIPMKWCNVPSPATVAYPQFLLEQRQGDTFVLLYDDTAHALTHNRKPDWTITASDPRSDDGYVALPFQLDSVGGTYMSDLTLDNLHRPLGIVLDGQLLTAPTIMSRIGADGQITFGDNAADNMAEAQQVQKTINAGSYPINFYFRSQSLK